MLKTDEAKRRHLRVLIVLAFIWAIGLELSLCQTNGTLVSAITLSKTQIPLHGVIIANVSITNNGSAKASVDLGADKEGAFTLDIEAPDGTRKHVSRKPLQYADSMAGPGNVEIDPGSTYNQELVLNEWYQFEITGTYQLTIKMKAYILPARSEVLESQCSETVLIEPSDPVQLVKSAQQLLETIKDARTYDESKIAALKLSAMQDPSVVEYLIQAADAKPWVAPILIDALRKIGNGDAIDGLVHLGTSTDSDTHMLSVATLRRMNSTETDPTLREKITSGLESITQHQP